MNSSAEAALKSALANVARMNFDQAIKNGAGKPAPFILCREGSAVAAAARRAAAFEIQAFHQITFADKLFDDLFGVIDVDGFNFIGLHLSIHD
jgi:hypothetical protein